MFFSCQSHFVQQQPARSQCTNLHTNKLAKRFTSEFSTGSGRINAHLRPETFQEQFRAIQTLPIEIQGSQFFLSLPRKKLEVSGKSFPPFFHPSCFALCLACVCFTNGLVRSGCLAVVNLSKQTRSSLADTSEDRTGRKKLE